MANDPSPVNSKVMLVASRALSASRPALIGFLIARGAELSGGAIQPISFCNILFVGNLCAALVVGFWFGFGNIVKDLKALDLKVQIGLLVKWLFGHITIGSHFLRVTGYDGDQCRFAGTLGAGLICPGWGRPPRQTN